MRIKLSPSRRDDTLTATKAGDVLTLNGDALDFGVIPDGGRLTADGIDNEWIVGDVVRVNGEIELTLVLPRGPYPSQAADFPEDLVDIPDGEIVFPDDGAPKEPDTTIDTTPDTATDNGENP